jgi:hypothetical protein
LNATLVAPTWDYTGSDARSAALLPRLILAGAEREIEVIAARAPQYITSGATPGGRA